MGAQPTTLYAVLDPFTGDVPRAMLTLHTDPAGMSLRLTVSVLVAPDPAAYQGPSSG